MTKQSQPAEAIKSQLLSQTFSKQQKDGAVWGYLQQSCLSVGASVKSHLSWFVLVMYCDASLTKAFHLLFIFVIWWSSHLSLIHYHKWKWQENATGMPLKCLIMKQGTLSLSRGTEMKIYCKCPDKLALHVTDNSENMAFKEEHISTPNCFKRFLFNVFYFWICKLLLLHLWLHS